MKVASTPFNQSPLVKAPSPNRRPAETGAALIITLLLMAFIAILVMGFVDAMQVERNVSAMHIEKTSAGTFAQMGIDTCIATLSRETRNPELYWISQPGALIVPKVGATGKDTKVLTREVPLSTGAASSNSSGDPVLQPPDLNISTISEQGHLLSDSIDSATGKAPVMQVRWLYQRRDGSLELPNPSLPIGSGNLPIENPNTTNKDNPIVGRFAYWADDESSKINYNLAWKRSAAISSGSTPNRSPLSDLSQINLLALSASGLPLTEKMADQLHNWATTKRYFNSFADARQLAYTEDADPNLTKILSHNKFELTHYNNDPDTTFFGEDRILLTTNRNLVPRIVDPKTGKVTYLRNFIDILRDDLSGVDLDPGNRDHIAGGQVDWSKYVHGTTTSIGSLPVLPNKFDGTFKMLLKYMNEANWPISPAGSNATFRDKYYPGYPSTGSDEARLGQIAVNIIDYVRAKESRGWMKGPLRFARSGTTYTLNHGVTAGGGNSFQGLARMPLFTEMGMWMESTPIPPANLVPPGYSLRWRPTSQAPEPVYRCYFRVELYLPPDYGNPDGIDLVPDLSQFPDYTSWGWYLTLTELGDHSVPGCRYYYMSPSGVPYKPDKPGTPIPTMYRLGQPYPHCFRIFKDEIIMGGQGPNGTRLLPGQYVVIEKIAYRNLRYGPNQNNVSRSTLSMRLGLGWAKPEIQNALYPDNTGLVQRTVPTDKNSFHFQHGTIIPQAESVSYTCSSQSTTPNRNDMASMEVDDPRASVNGIDWQRHISGRNSFGVVNSRSTLGKPASGIMPEQDTDATGRIYGSLYMPPPAGMKIGTGRNANDNSMGRVTSVGELGYIHTGLESNSTPIAGKPRVTSVPWRTIRLQPNKYPDSTTLPDWAFMDLFAAPVSSSLTLVPNTNPPLPDDGIQANFQTPHGTSVSGRINVNCHPEPFPLERKGGLLALLTGTEYLNTNLAATNAATNIYNRTLAANGKLYGYPWKSKVSANESNAFDSLGEICEIKGVADGGEQSEDLLREILSLVTTRGNVFSIYTIGQSLKQTPNGKLIVTAEQRQQAMIERWQEDVNNTPHTKTDDTVRFRTVYFRNLTP